MKPAKFKLRRKMARDSREAGYVLILILFMLALLTYAIVTAAPAIARQIQREREEEAIHRGQQYVRGIRLFYRKFGRYPNSIKDLLSTNNMRFLRKEYKDPISPGGEWHLIHPGEALFNPTGFFGKSLLPAGTDASSLQPVGGPAQNQNQNSNQPGSAQPGNQNSQAGGEQSLFGSNKGAPAFGGGPVVGVSPESKDKSLIVYNGKDHYNEWQFVYDPRMEQQMAGVAGAVPGGIPAGQVGSQPQQPQQNFGQNPNPNPGAMQPQPQ
jgi:type II secretory pathway pseudopilin PulG